MSTEIAVTDEMIAARDTFTEFVNRHAVELGAEDALRIGIAMAEAANQNPRNTCWSSDYVAESHIERDAAVAAREYWHGQYRCMRAAWDDTHTKLMDTRRKVIGLEAELALARGIITALTTPQAPPGDVTTARKPMPWRALTR